MTNETQIETDTKQERQSTALAYAGILALAAWQAARTDGAEKTPEMVAEIERRLEAGTATLAINVQRIGDTVRLTAAVLEATGFQDAFDHPILDLTGPLILSRDQLARVAVVKPGAMN